ncbi:MAG TPA: hypothetical protein VIB39_10905 [Candidatus Angelobacter sp.]
MNRLILAAILAVFVWPALSQAQVKVAEGEYHMRGSSDGGGKRAMDHWILYTRKQGGYRLESEVTASAETGVIVIQTEELDDRLNPTAINLRLYTHENTKKPFSALACLLTAEHIACKAGGLDLPLSGDVDQKSPVLLAVNSLDRVDLMWMIAGAIQRAHFDDGKASVPTLVLRDGEDGPELAQTEIDGLRDEGNDKDALAIASARVPVRRYSTSNSKLKCWVAGSGLLLKMENEDGEVIELENFKQYRKLVPELPVTQ